MTGKLEVFLKILWRNVKISLNGLKTEEESLPNRKEKSTGCLCVQIRDIKPLACGWPDQQRLVSLYTKASVSMSHENQFDTLRDFERALTIRSGYTRSFLTLTNKPSEQLAALPRSR